MEANFTRNHMIDDNEDPVFVDTRLYITVRPVLEYRMIEVGQQCVARMVGDNVSEQEYTNVGFCGSDAPTFASLENAGLSELCSLCMTVCSNTEEYLRNMEMEWIEFLSRIHTGMHSELRIVRKQMEEARRVRQRYLHVHNDDVHAEIASEMKTLHDRMEDILDRYRTAEIPRVQRSQELRVASTQLRNDFGKLYGTIPTSNLTRLKHAFEGEMSAIQESVARSFDRRLNDILRRR